MVLDLSSFAGKCVGIDVRTLEVLAAAEDPNGVLKELQKRRIDTKRVSIYCVSKPDEAVVL